MQKQSNSVRLPHSSKLTTSKTKEFCETSFKNGKVSAELTTSYQCVLRYFHSTCLKYCACQEKWCQVIGSAALVTQNHLPKFQNATPLRKSAPGPPNISYEHVSCLAPATENASLQILFNCPTPAIVFEHATKPSRFSHFWQGAQSLAPATRNDIWTPKSGPNMWCFIFFNILTSKCASRHNGVHFFDISTSKSGPNMWCFFLTFDFEMCFVPQRRALFRHLNFQSGLNPSVFYTFDFEMCFVPQSAPNMRCFVHFDFEMCFALQQRAIVHLSSGQLAPHPPL